ncbi:MAG TPA: zinc ribbon domain-containing protein, partial [Acidimicrobiia bacterium]|nr:zinc ribbon domain-containing protein [Acidimicrobiia bacterium]
PSCVVFADGQADGLGRLWPMVEALAGRPVEVTFTGQRAGADIAVDVSLGAGSAWAQAVRPSVTGMDQEDVTRLADPAGALAPAVGGLDMPAWWRREERDLLGLRGGRCEACGRVEYPVPPAGCPRCGSAVLPHGLATTGRVLTWTADQLYEYRVTTGMAVVDLAGGGRFYGQLADGWDTAAIRAGGAARLVPRVLHADERRTAYFWKVTIGGEGQGE